MSSDEPNEIHTNVEYGGKLKWGNICCKLYSRTLVLLRIILITARRMDTQAHMLTHTPTHKGTVIHYGLNSIPHLFTNCKWKTGWQLRHLKLFA